MKGLAVTLSLLSCLVASGEESVSFPSKGSYLNQTSSNYTDPGGTGSFVGSSISGAEATIIFGIICIIIGALCRGIKKKLSLPYMPLLILSGVILGWGADSLGYLGKSVLKVMEIEPKTILFTFVPVLTFEIAFNIDPFVFKKQMVQVLLLAVPGVFIGMILNGFFFKMFLGYGSEISWVEGLLMGSLMSATDPIAVVVLLKEIGTSKTFNVLLEGESLINDGTALVLFLIFSEAFKSGSLGLFSTVFQFLKLSIGGVIVGVCVALALLFWIRGITRDKIMITTLSFLSCFISFLLSEEYFKVSGMIAIVACGLTMGRLGKLQILPDVQRSMHDIWSFAQFLSETMLYVMTGSIIGEKILTFNLSTITFGDFLLSIFFFALIVLGRYLMLVILQPLMNRFGFPLDTRDIIVLTYSGLRGAITTCLALFIVIDVDYSQRFRDLVIFHTTLVVLYTVLINGLTVKYLIRRVQFKTKTVAEQKLELNVQKKLVVESIKRKRELEISQFFQQVDWNTAIDLTHIKVYMNQITNVENELHQKNSTEMFSARDSALFARDESLIETRLRVYQLLKSETFAAIKDNLFESNIVQHLKDAIDICADEPKRPIWVWENLSENFLSFEKINSLYKLRHKFIIGYFIDKILLMDLHYLYDCLLLSTLVMREVSINKRYSVPMSSSLIDIVFGELEANLKQSEYYLFHFIEFYPELAKDLQNRKAAKMILNTEKVQLQDLLLNGMIDETNFERITDSVDSRIRRIDFERAAIELKNVHTLKVISPIFNLLSENEFEFLESKLCLMNFEKDQKLYLKERIITGVYVIANGLVVEEVDEARTHCGSGQVLNFANLISTSGFALSTAIAESNTTAYFIANHVLMSLMSRNDQFEEAVYRSTLPFMLRIYSKMTDSNEITQTVMKAAQGSFMRERKGSTFSLPFGGFLFSGELSCTVKEETQPPAPKGATQLAFSETTLVPPNELYEAISDVRLLGFFFKDETEAEPHAEQQNSKERPISKIYEEDVNKAFVKAMKFVGLRSS